MANDAVAVVVGASAEELAHVQHCLPDWECVAVSVSHEAGVESIPETVGLLLVYARKAEKEAVAICEQLRNAPETSDTPILLVISRYQLAQAHAVKRMGHAGFVMTPFDEKQICDRIEECFGISQVRTRPARTGER